MPCLSPLFRLSLLSIVSITLPSCAQSQVEPPQAAKGGASKSASRSLRTLIVSGGPDAESNQYAIESNARYVEKLTATGQSQRILFADGSRNSRTISTYEQPDYFDEIRVSMMREFVVLAWLLGHSPPTYTTVMKAPTLKRLDGASNPKTILSEVDNFAKSAKTGERGLLYFTGHGSEGTKGGVFGFLGTQDFDNTRYNGWGGDLSVQELATPLQNWPADVPLTLVMVQCHSGGFANLIWQGGDSKNAVWPRDFCGFFAATAERMSSGCTSEVDERDYHDFTTHFFAALSGVSRDGRIITGADFDHNGAVSGLEAFAYTNLYDNSIDVPICTSDLYLRRIFSAPNEKDWLQTPYSTLLKNANPWQKAILNGLSRELGLSGEAQLKTAAAAQSNLNTRIKRAGYRSVDYDYYGLKEPSTEATTRLFYKMEADILRRFPALKSRTSRSYGAAKSKALDYLNRKPTQVATLYAASQVYEDATVMAEKREAKLWRFLRAARTVVLQKRLQERGTAEQKAVFARLRSSESRNFLK